MVGLVHFMRRVLAWLGEPIGLEPEKRFYVVRCRCGRRAPQGLTLLDALVQASGQGYRVHPSWGWRCLDCQAHEWWEGETHDD